MEGYRENTGGKTSELSPYNEIEQRLKTAILNDRLAHGYIIEGDELAGKKAFAKSFAKRILCRELPGEGCDNCKTCRMVDKETYRDLYVVTGDERSVKDREIEEIQSRLGNRPVEESGRNIAIIEKSDTMTSRAQNRLLKVLEEPAEGTVIMLLSENSDMLLPTVRSRCQFIRLNAIGYGRYENKRQIKYVEAAKTLIKMAEGKSYFFEIKKIIEEFTGSRDDARALLDALEREFRDILIDDKTSTNRRDWAMASIKAIEDVRKDFKYNVRERYALSQLMLKIGG